MSKKSRTFQPSSQSGVPQPTDDEGGTGSQSPSSGASRAEARRQSAGTASASGSNALGRYRGALLLGAVVLGLVVVGFFMVQSSGPTYACDSLLTPGPSEPVPAAAAGPAGSTEPGASPVASPGAAPTPRLGFTTIDMGRDHASTNSRVRYAFCPPTSGGHWSVAGLSPLRRDFYAPDDGVAPGSWIHNLEHGYVVIAYRDDPGEAALEPLRSVFMDAPPSEVAIQCGMPNKVIVLRFDDMSEPYALLSWDRALLMSTFEPEQVLTFIEQWQDGPQTPERSC